MHNIYIGQKVKIVWTILKGLSQERESFDRANVRVFLTQLTEGDNMADKIHLIRKNDTEGYHTGYYEQTKGVISIELDNVLTSGVYGVKAIWSKNDGRSVVYSEKSLLFAVTDNREEAENPDASRVEITVKSSTATYGLDGLSAYETAVMHDLTTYLTEKEWVQVRSRQIETNQIKDGAVTTAKIANEAVTTDKIPDEAIASYKIADEAVTERKIADEAVTTEKLENDSVTNKKIADWAVTTEKLAEGAVMSADIAEGAVITQKIANGAVTTEKIRNGAVTTDKIGDGEVKSANIANGAVVAEKIEDGCIDGGKIADRSITGQQIADKVIVGDHIANGAISSEKFADGGISAHMLEVEKSVVEANENVKNAGEYAKGIYDAISKLPEGITQMDAKVIKNEADISVLKQQINNVDADWVIYDKDKHYKEGSVGKAIGNISANTLSYDPNTTYSPNTVGKALKDLDGVAADAERAEAAASSAAESVARLEEAIQNLPDGSAVSAKVAEHDVKLGEIELDINGSWRITSYTPTGFYIDGTNMKWASVQGFDSALVATEKTKGSKVTIDASNNGSSVIAFLKSAELIAGNKADFCDGYRSSIVVATNSRQEFVIPMDCEFLYIYTKGSNIDRSPKSIVGKKTAIKDDVEELKNTVDNVVAKVGDVKDVDCSQLFKDNVFISGVNGEWYDGGQSYASSVVDVRKYASYEMKITASNNGDSVVAFLKSAKKEIGSKAVFCDGYEGNISISQGSTKILSIPIDCIFLYVYRTSSGTDRTPSSLSFLRHSELDKLKNVVTDDIISIDDVTFVQGRYLATGVFASADNRIATYMNCDKKMVIVNVNSGYKMAIGYYNNIPSPDSLIYAGVVWQEGCVEEIVPEGTKYIHINVAKKDDTTITPDLKKAAISKIKLLSDMGFVAHKVDSIVGSGNSEYVGEPIDLSRKKKRVYDSNVLKVFSKLEYNNWELSCCQSAALCNGYMFLAYQPTIEPIDVYGSGNSDIVVIDMNTLEPICRFNYGVYDSHANNIQFTDEYYNENDEFPLCIISAYTAKRVDVVRVTRNGAAFSGQVIATISTDIPYATWCYDADTRKMIAIYYKNGNYNTDKATNAVFFAEFDFGTFINGGNLPLANAEKIIKTNHWCVVQGCFALNGRIYLYNTNEDEYNNIPVGLWVINEASGEIESIVPILRVWEAEGLTYDGNSLYFVDRKGRASDEHLRIVKADF